MSSTFWTAVESLESLSTMGRLNQWKTRKELEDKYGKEEFQVLIDDNSFLVRPNPLNPKLRLYLDRTDTLTTSLSRGTKWSASGTTKTDKQQHSSLMDAFRGADLDEDMLEKVHLGMYCEPGQQLGPVDDNMDAKTLASLPPALKRRRNIAKDTEAQQAQTPGQSSAQEVVTGDCQSNQGKKEKVDLLAKVVEEFSAEDEVDWTKVGKVQGLLSKGKQSISSLLFSIKFQELKPDKTTLTKCNKLVQEMKALHDKMDTLMCQKTASKKLLLVCLNKAVSIYKEGQTFNTLLGAFTKKGSTPK